MMAFNLAFSPGETYPTFGIDPARVQKRRCRYQFEHARGRNGRRQRVRRIQLAPHEIAEAQQSPGLDVYHEGRPGYRVSSSQQLGGAMLQFGVERQRGQLTGGGLASGAAGIV
jgi:hypothetical protein